MHPFMRKTKTSAIPVVNAIVEAKVCFEIVLRGGSPVLFRWFWLLPRCWELYDFARVDEENSSTQASAVPPRRFSPERFDIMEERLNRFRDGLSAKAPIERKEAMTKTNENFILTQ